MAGAACKLLLCGNRFAAETTIADGVAALTNMPVADLDALIIQKLGSQATYDALVAALGGGIEAMKKVNEVLMP